MSHKATEQHRKPCLEELGDFTTTARVNPNAQVTAGGSLQIQSQTGANAESKADSTAVGFGGDSDANDDGRDISDSDSRGVRIGRSQGSTQTEIAGGAKVSGRYVDIDATVSDIRAVSTSNSEADAVGADADSLARSELHSTAAVDIRAGAQLTARQQLNIVATHQALGQNADANGECDCGGGDTDVTTILVQDVTSRINAEAGATVTAGQLSVQALAYYGYYYHYYRDSALIDIGGADAKISVVPVRTITWNANVIISVSPELEINSVGGLLRADHVAYTDTGSRIIVNYINFGNPHVARFEANHIDNDLPHGLFAPPGAISGNQSTFDFRETFGRVDITNNSTKDLEINAIDVVNRGSGQTVDIAVEIVGLEFFVMHSFRPTIVEIQNLSGVGSPNLYLSGLIENPIGTTHLVNTRNDILSTRTQALIRTNIFRSEAALGSVGTVDLSSTPRINLELVLSQGRPIQIAVSAGRDVALDLKGRVRDPAVNAFNLNLDTLAAGDDLDLTLQAAVKETTMSSVSYHVDVVETFVPQTTAVIDHFRPGPAGPASPLDLGIFAVGPSPINSTYNYALDRAGDNIDILAFPAGTRIDINGYTNLLGLGRINVQTNGNIVLTETDGDMRIGAITSTAADVTLVAPASIVDALNDPASDVNGSKVTLTAQTGTIGSRDNHLEINSDLLKATAFNSIYIEETQGDLNIDQVVSSTGTVTLIGVARILDADGAPDQGAADIIAGWGVLVAASGVGASNNACC